MEKERLDDAVKEPLRQLHTLSERLEEADIPSRLTDRGGEHRRELLKLMSLQAVECTFTMAYQALDHKFEAQRAAARRVESEARLAAELKAKAAMDVAEKKYEEAIEPDLQAFDASMDSAGVDGVATQLEKAFTSMSSGVEPGEEERAALEEQCAAFGEKIKPAENAFELATKAAFDAKVAVDEAAMAEFEAACDAAEAVFKAEVARLEAAREETRRSLQQWKESYLAVLASL
jgi:hypothetical protein